MNTENFETRVLQRTLAIQGLSASLKNREDGQLPIFNVSPRRTITDQYYTILEQHPIDQEFEMITIENHHEEPMNAVVFEVGLTTDFWYGFGSLQLSDTGFLILHNGEEAEQIKWEQTNNKHYPVIHTNKRTINPLKTTTNKN